LLPPDVWDALLDQVAIVVDGSRDVQEVTSLAAIVEVTTGFRIGLGPASTPLEEAGISSEVEVIGAGPYLVLRPTTVLGGAAESPVADLWDRAWGLLHRARTR
jgi:hypothetical protein